MGGPQPVSISEMLAYLQAFDIEPCRRGRYIDVLQEMDGAYMAHALEKVQASQAGR